MQAPETPTVQRRRWLGIAVLLFLTVALGSRSDPAGASDAGYGALETRTAVVGSPPAADPVLSAGVANTLVALGLVGIALFPYRFGDERD